MTKSLDWPLELADTSITRDARWVQPSSNICLDFHGDPQRAGLVVFSDGNHHMALEEALQGFLQKHPEVGDIFYATTPPSVIIQLMKSGKIVLGNLCLSIQPDIFISPTDIMAKLATDGFISRSQTFMQSRGNVIIFRHGNPKNITSISDLFRDDVRLFFSNPINEGASYQLYKSTFSNLAQQANLSMAQIDARLGNKTHISYGDRIHHRELPQALFSGEADAAIIYYHLALRFTRIFANSFDFLPLGGTKDDPQPVAGNLTTAYTIGMLDSHNPWRQAFYDFMQSDNVTDIYRRHGLTRP